MNVDNTEVPTVEKRKRANASQKKYYQNNREDILPKKREEKKRNADKYWHRDLKRKYGITKEEYTRLLEKQNGTCAICHGTQHVRLDVDHCHSTGRVRGLLCRRCNLMIGHGRNDLNILKKAIQYLTENGE